MNFKVIITEKHPHIDSKILIRIVDVPTKDFLENKDDIILLLEKIFFYGQNDFQPKKCPSVSSGDIVVVFDKFYLCKPVGWEEIPFA